MTKSRRKRVKKMAGRKNTTGDVKHSQKKKTKKQVRVCQKIQKIKIKKRWRE